MMTNLGEHPAQLVRPSMMMAGLVAVAALLLVSNVWPVAAAAVESNVAESEMQMPRLFQEATSDSKAQPNGGPIKSLLSDSGELTIMSKRRSGFLPSRGKKDADTYGPEVDGDQFDPEAARMAFLTEAAKRASGFLPMRGRKSSAEVDNYNNYYNAELMEKRRVAAFMPMRGRKWSGQPESAGAPATSNVWYPRFYHPVPFGSMAAALGESSPILLPSALNDDQDLPNLEKRKGMGFFGARGKRSARLA